MCKILINLERERHAIAFSYRVYEKTCLHVLNPVILPPCISQTDDVLLRMIRAEKEREREPGFNIPSKTRSYGGGGSV